MTDSRDPAAMAAACVDHGAALLGLTIEPAWREGVVRNLGGYLVAARLVKVVSAHVSRLQPPS